MRQWETFQAQIEFRINIGKGLITGGDFEMVREQTNQRRT